MYAHWNLEHNRIVLEHDGNEEYFSVAEVGGAIRITEFYTLLKCSGSDWNYDDAHTALVDLLKAEVEYLVQTSEAQ